MQSKGHAKSSDWGSVKEEGGGGERMTESDVEGHIERVRKQITSK
jgi:hypothetical protein